MLKQQHYIDVRGDFLGPPHQHNDNCCGLNYLLKKILRKYSIQNLKTADSVLLSLFMRDNGRDFLRPTHGHNDSYCGL